VLILSVVSAVVCGFLPPYSMMLRFRWTWVAAMHFLWTAIFVTQLAMLKLAPRRYANSLRFLIVACLPAASWDIRLCGAGGRRLPHAAPNGVARR